MLELYLVKLATSHQHFTRCQTWSNCESLHWKQNSHVTQLSGNINVNSDTLKTILSIKATTKSAKVPWAWCTVLRI